MVHDRDMGRALAFLNYFGFFHRRLQGGVDLADVDEELIGMEESLEFCAVALDEINED